MWQKRNKKSVFFPKGSVTVFALLLMFILAATTIGIISTAAIERKVSISTGNSTTAFQIAESGMERTLQYFKSNFDKKLSDVGSCAVGTGIVTYNSNNTIRFRDNIDPSDNYITNCNTLISNVKIIKSIGTNKQETRAIEEDVFFGATKLLLHLNGVNSETPPRFGDSSFYWNNHRPITASNGVSVESDDINLRKFGEGSAKFNGTTGYLSVPDSDDWDFGAGDFTLDWWEYRTDSVNTRATLQRQNTTVGYNPFLAGYKNGANLEFYASSNGSTWDIASAKSMGTATLNDWTHLAIVRKGTNFYTFKDGQQQAAWSSALAFPNVSASLEIGRYQDNKYFVGYIDELRISKGVARWTANFNPYNPPAEYWPD